MTQIRLQALPATHRSRNAVAVLLAVGCMVGAGAVLHNTVYAASTLPVRSSQEFIDSMGVAAHFSAADYPESAEMLKRMQYLGMTHVRTNSAVTDKGSGKGAKTAKLLGENGVKLHFTTPKPKGKRPSNQAIHAAVDARISYITRNGLVDYTESLEPFNEYDNVGVKNWPNVLQEAMAYMNSQRSKLGKDTKILGPSLIGFKLSDTSARFRTAVGSRTQSTFDYGNVHSYYGGGAPETSLESSTPSEAYRQFNKTPSSKSSNSLESRLQYYATNISGDKPIIVTEMGYTNDRVGKKGGVSEKASGTYMPRAYLENFRIGVLRSYAYELADEPHASPSSEQHFGLYRADGTPKPAATAISNMSGLLRGATVKAVTPLPVKLSGDTANLRTVILQKHDGEYYIALWRQLSVYDTKSRKDTPAKSAPATLTFDGSKTLALYDNLSSSTVRQQPYGNKLSATVQVGADVVLLKVSR